MADIFPGARLIPTAGFFPRPTPSAGLVFSVIHTTANLGSAANQATYAARPSPGVTATFWVDRDGSVVQSLDDPLRKAPWTNGVWQNPDMSNPRIASARNSGVNPNLRTLVSIENVSLEPGSPITAAQEATCARIIQHYHAAAGVPISRQTVIGHYQITAIDRPNCPARDKSVLDRIVAIANGAPATGGGATDMTVTYKTYPWPREWRAKGGTLTGYKLSDDPNPSGNFGAGSLAHSSAQVTINPLPADWGWPAGPYQLVSDGPLAGSLVANSQIDLGAEPLPLPAPPSTTPAPPADCSALEKQVADLQTNLTAVTKVANEQAEELDKARLAVQTLTEL